MPVSSHCILLASAQNMLDFSLDPEVYAYINSAQSSPLTVWTFFSEIIPNFAGTSIFDFANFGTESTVKLFTFKDKSRQNITIPAAEGTIGDIVVFWNDSGPMPDVVYQNYCWRKSLWVCFWCQESDHQIRFCYHLIYVATLRFYVLYALWNQLNMHPFAIASFGGSHIS